MGEQGTATFIRNVNPDSPADQRQYLVEPPLDGHDFVVVSATEDRSGRLTVDKAALFALAGLASRLLGEKLDYGHLGAETFIFPSNNVGKIVGRKPLPGSFQGGANHEEALRRAGYALEDTV